MAGSLMTAMVSMVDARSGETVFFWPRDAMVFTATGSTNGTARVVVRTGLGNTYDADVHPSQVGNRAHQVASEIWRAAYAESTKIIAIPPVDPSLSDPAGTMLDEQTPGA